MFVTGGWMTGLIPYFCSLLSWWNIYTLGRYAIEKIVLVCRVCCIREMTSKCFSTAAQRFKWWQVWQRGGGVIAQANISENFFPAQSSGNSLRSEKPWTVLLKCMQWFIINPNHLHPSFFFLSVWSTECIHQFYYSNRKCLGEKHRNT